MNMNLPLLIDTFPHLRVLVIGEAMLDIYLEGSSGRLCREAPVPIVTVSDRRVAPGGAANAAVNVASLGGKVTFLSVVGYDLEANILKDAIRDRGVSTEHVLTQPFRSTISKQRVIADSQMLVRFDQGSGSMIDRETEQLLTDRLACLFPSCDAVVVSDYGYGVLTPGIIQTLADLQSRSPRPIVVDSKKLTAYRPVGVTAVKPNYGEAVHLLGVEELEDPGDRAKQIPMHAGQLFDLTGAQIAAVTLDTDGALIFERGCPPYRTYARPARHSRAAGAGDTFISAFALALAAGGDTPAAAELASAAAAVVVGKEWTATCSGHELREKIAGGGKYLPDNTRLGSRVDLYRQQGQRIVFTNGFFDLLQKGHIAYLNHAKSLGDVLIVGVNSDVSVRRLKGPGRPINTLEDRAQVLAALSSVDLVVAFDADTPHDLIRSIRPDVFAKGGDYTREMLPEGSLVEELGGTVRILPYVEDRSTSDIIDRIRGGYAQPVAGRTRGQKSG